LIVGRGCFGFLCAGLNSSSLSLLLLALLETDRAGDLATVEGGGMLELCAISLDASVADIITGISSSSKSSI
jgi:hypothetical protein